MGLAQRSLCVGGPFVVRPKGGKWARRGWALAWRFDLFKRSVADFSISCIIFRTQNQVRFLDPFSKPSGALLIVPRRWRSGSFVLLKYMMFGRDSTPTSYVLNIFEEVPHSSSRTYDFQGSKKTSFWGATGCRFADRLCGGWGGGKRWDGSSAALPARAARNKNGRISWSLFLNAGYAEICPRGTVFGTVFGYVFRTQIRARFSVSQKDPLLQSEKRTHF